MCVRRPGKESLGRFGMKGGPVRCRSSTKKEFSLPRHWGKTTEEVDTGENEEGRNKLLNPKRIFFGSGGSLQYHGRSIVIRIVNEMLRWISLCSKADDLVLIFEKIYLSSGR